MREAYKDVMDRIEVTPEMQTRILKAIRDADIQGRSKRAVPMGRLAIAACLAGALCRLRSCHLAALHLTGCHLLISRHLLVSCHLVHLHLL